MLAFISIWTHIYLTVSVIAKLSDTWRNIVRFGDKNKLSKTKPTCKFLTNLARFPLKLSIDGEY